MEQKDGSSNTGSSSSALSAGNGSQGFGEDEADHETSRGNVSSASDAGSLPPNEPVDLTRSAATMILNLRSNGGLTSAVIARFQDACFKMTENVVSSLRQKVQNFLEAENIANTQSARALMRDLDVPNPFKSLKTLKQQLNYFATEMGLALPVPHFLGYRTDTRLNPQTNQFEPVMVSATFEYIPIIETLKLVLSDRTLRSLIEAERASNDGVLRSYLDGSRGKQNELVNQYPHIIRIQLHCDDVDLVNPLGSRTVIHKLTSLCFSIQNFPPEESSVLSSIYLLALAYSEDLKMPNAMSKFLYPFLQDLKELEGPAGVPIVLDGNDFTLRATLATLCADTLAAHDILGYLSPSARYFCRRCKITRPQFHADVRNVGERRTKDSFELDLARVKGRGPAYSTECGIRAECHFHKAAYFSAPDDSPFDIFHDLLEGVCHATLALASRYFVVDKKHFSIESFNSRVQHFIYGIPDSKNKPSANFTLARIHGSHFLQKGSQVWCLTRVFGFLIPEVPEGDPYLKLVNLLQEIMLIVFAVEVREEDILKLETLIEQFHCLFQQLHIGPLELAHELEEEEEAEAIPREGIVQAVIRRVNPVNKLHHMRHYPELIRELGPLVRYWCIRYEARYHLFAKYASVCCNFMNLPKTMTQMLQISTLSGILESKPRLEDIEMQSAEEVSVNDCDHSELLLLAGLSQNDIVCHTEAVIVVSDDFRPGLFIVIDPRLPEFAVIQHIYCFGAKVFFVVMPWETQHFAERFCAYKVRPKPNSALTLIQHDELRHHRPFGPWNPFGQSDTYVSPRTIMF
ncbi:hypothetical protein KUF71_017743 [Frankliniella fusca]|uniref:Uncharacterized protein n=1 Tax=Frankliniella fusca TaxID=407009 RepID=A0AAE1LRD0_9NEOP|nr:hypothetical protein KUF71_017743 [Frankliniella fusca]